MNALGWIAGTGGVMFVAGLILSALSGPLNESDSAFLIVVGLALIVGAGVVGLVFG